MILAEGDRHTLSVIVMDRSGSMGRFREAPQAAMNGHIANLQKQENAPRTSAVIVSFADDARIETPHAPLSAIRQLTGYKPEGMTRLHWTIADVLRALIPVSQRPELQGRLEVVVAVFTDGKDDPATDPSELRSLALEAQMIGFKLMFIGIGVDVKKKAPEIGFPLDLAFTVAASAEGISSSMARVTRITGMAMAGRDSPLN